MYVVAGGSEEAEINAGGAPGSDDLQRDSRLIVVGGSGIKGGN